MDFNPMMAPQGPSSGSGSGGGNTTLYIVLFLLCVISVMAGVFRYQTQSAASKAEAEMKKVREEAAANLERIQSEAASAMEKAQSDFEKQQIQAEAAERARSAKLQADAKAREAQIRANVKAREAQLKKLESKVNADLAAAAKTVKNANDLKAKADAEKAAAVKQLKEAQEAQEKAEATGKENDKKLAEEKNKMAIEAGKRVAEANAKADAAAKKAREEAKKAQDLKQKLDKANATIKGNENELAAATYNAVPGYQIRATAGKGNKFNVTGPKACIEEAKKLKANVWGYRNSKHPTKKYKKSCFFMAVKSNEKYSGNPRDSIHMIGCTYGGNPKTGCDLPPKATVVSATAKKVAKYSSTKKKSTKKKSTKKKRTSRTAKKAAKYTSTKSKSTKKSDDSKIYLYRIFGKTKKRYCFRTGSDIECSSPNRRGSHKQFVMRDLGNSQVALKLKGVGKWCADEGDKVNCNRSSIGSWEKFTLSKSGSGFKLKGGKNDKWCRRVNNKIRCDRDSSFSADKFYSVKRRPK